MIETALSYQQTESLKAIVKGEPYTTMPKDLYIPPDALEIFLETFQGPLDLLLYLIKRQNIDILDIPIADITRQYMEYVEVMRENNFELAAEYLVMAAMLAEIKSCMLLPRHTNEEGEEEDPRAELVRRLQEYECYRQAAEELDTLPRRGRDTFAVTIDAPYVTIQRPVPQVELQELLMAFQDVLNRAELAASHHIQQEPLSIRERMLSILSALRTDKFVPFAAFFKLSEGRMGLVVTFIAVLELFKDSAIEVVQSKPFAPIYIKPSQMTEDN